MTLTSSYQYIGRSNAVGCPSGYKYYILLYAKATYNSSTGKHSVTVKQRMACNVDSTFYDWSTSGSVTVAGVSAFSWSGAHVPGSAWNSNSITAGDYTYPRWIDLKEGTVEVSAQEVTITSSWVMNETNSAGWFPYTGTYANSSVKVELPVTAVASVPTVSASSVVMLNTVTISTNRQSSAYTHDLTYSFGGSTGAIATGVGASYTWTVPDLVAKIAGKTSGTCTITCKTKNGSTVIGTKTVTLTLTVPAKSTPSASASTVKMGTSVNIYTNRKSTGFTHTLTYTIGDYTGTIDTGVEGGRTWTPPKSLAAYTGNKTSAVCTITCKTYTGSTLVGTATSAITLTVPDATVPKLSASTVAMGSAITISMPKEAAAYTHDLTYALKAAGSTTVAASGTIATGVSADYAWTVPTSLALKVPNATNGTITITCKTRFANSETTVGTETVSFAVTIPNNSTMQPQFTMAFSPVSDLPSAFSGVYVAGKSKVKVAYTVTSDHSTIKSFLTTVNGSSGSTNPYTSGILSSSGTVNITGKVTDSRGYATTKKGSIQVIPYSRPRITPGEGKSSIVCTRCNSDGKADPGGVYLLIQIGRKYSPVTVSGTQKNYCKISYRYKTDGQDDSEYSEPVTLLARTATSDYVSKTISGIVTSNTTAYNIQLIAEDDVGEKDTVTITVPTAFVVFHVPEGGHGFTLGGYHDPSKVDVFDCRFDAEFQGDVTGRVLGMGALPEIPEEADVNDYKEFGTYAINSNAVAKTIINLPEEKGGTLRVWSSNGKGITTGNYVYIIQEYIPYDNYCSWRRVISRGTGEWNYGMWKAVSGINVIVDQGVTDDWYWRKYANGIAECWRRVKNAARDVNTQFGSMYYANCDEVEFPFGFYTAPVVNATVESGTALVLMSWQGTDGNGTTTATKPASYRVMRPTTITGASFTIAYHAIGRWK